MDKIVLLFLFVLTLLTERVSAEKKLLCYYGSWATYRHGNGKYDVQDLDPFICTHLIYSFVGINTDGTIRIMDPWLELPDNWGRDNFGEFNRLKKVNPKLKTFVAVGGWNEGSSKFSIVANDPALRTKFARNSAEFAVKYGFDGIDMDWEYPGQRDSPNKQTDRQAFSLLMKEMRSQCDQKKLLLTAAVSASEAVASVAYDIPTISKYLDLINLMAYDFRGGWDSTTGHNAALKKYDANSLYDEAVVTYWLSQGAPPEKLILGIPLYGRTFRLADPSKNGVGAQASGPGLAGQYTSEAGMIGYNELCEKRLTQTWPEIWDDEAVVPYTVRNNDWITYDNERSIIAKVSYLSSKSLGGAMVWSIETDDFKNVCGRGKYPLLETINAGLGIVSSTTSSPNTTTTTTRWTSTTTRPSLTTTGPGSNATTLRPSTTTQSTFVKCTETGYIRDPQQCDVFYFCFEVGNGKFLMYKFTCPKGTVFDTVNQICNYPDKVECNR